ncbi:MAG: indole-3-glycerol phosphate synthase TrpC [Kofleriaceae bacterium]
MLDRILRAKAIEVAAAKQRTSLAELDAKIRRCEPARGLKRALARPAGAPVRVLAEVKRASPSAGPIRPGADPAEVAAEYADAGASAISVLTDREFFDGALEFLASCRARVPVPLLRKDFIIDSYQVAEARAAGADAVLLIVAALSPAQLAELLAAATSVGLDALVEIHDRAEADVALAAGTTLLGINHRNLKTLEIDMSLTPAIAPQLPPGVVLVAESGIRTAADVSQLGAAGAHAVLVGEHLMRAASPGAALRALREGA